jgi:hypothetical protein
VAKATKARAHYRAGTSAKRCGLCTMFRSPHGCTAVAGRVSRAGLCDYFKRAKATFRRNYRA